MSLNIRLLIAESEGPESREKRREAVGRSNGESYRDCVLAIVPDAVVDVVRPADPNPDRPELASYDGIFLSGSPMHVYKSTPPVMRVLEFMRAVFASGTPSFGSCAGLQVAAAAAGGTVRENRQGHEAAFARRITPTEAGRAHGLLTGRPAAFDALAIHSDEVDSLPDGATLLATNGVTAVQAAEIRCGNGVFWGVQYHPELPLDEVATALRRQSEDLIDSGLAAHAGTINDYASRIDALHAEPMRRDLAWQLGVDAQVTDPHLRRAELRNFIEHLVRPAHAARQG